MKKDPEGGSIRIVRRYALELEGQRIELAEGKVTLGRSRDLEVSLQDPSVSRHHAVVELRDGLVTLTDLESSNGTFVNGRQISGTVPLADGDRLTLGESHLTLRINEERYRTEGAVRLGPNQTFCPECGGVVSVRATLCPRCGKALAPSGPQAAEPAPPVVPPPPARIEPAPAPPQPSPPPSSPLPPAAPAVPPADQPSDGGEVLSPIGGLEGPEGAPGQEPEAPPQPATGPPRLPPAGFWIRTAAVLLDFVWMGGLIFALSFVARGAVAQMALSVISAGLGLLVPVVGWARWGATPGKAILGLSVRTLDGAAGVGLGRAIVRWLGYLLSVLVAGVGFLMVGFSKDKRALHDHLAGTYVGRRR